MKFVARPAHVKPGISLFLECRWGISKCIMGVIVGLWALECWVMLREVWLNEGDSVRWIDTREECRAQSLK